jgi:hypothetical protein
VPYAPLHARLLQDGQVLEYQTPAPAAKDGEAKAKK